MAGNRQDLQQGRQKNKNKKKRKHRNLTYYLCLPVLAAAMILGGCSLAVPDEGMEAGGDRLIGAFITWEYLDLYDMDAFFQDHAGQLAGERQLSGMDLAGYQTKLFADVEKHGSGSPFDWEVSFPGAEGICFFSPTWTDEFGGEYQGSVIDPMICDVDNALHTADEGDTRELTGTIWCTPGADAGEDLGFYLNPVYQTPQGDIYLMAGTGCSVRQADAEIPEGAQASSSLTDERKLWENGKEKTEKSSVTVKLGIMYEPVKVTLCQMDAGHQVLKEESFDPQDVPDQLDTQPGTAYILSETEKISPTGKPMLTRAVYEKQEGKEDLLESFQMMENGRILRRELAVKWNG